MKTNLGILLSIILGVAAGTAVALFRDSDGGAQYERMIKSSQTLVPQLTTVVSAGPANSASANTTASADELQTGIFVEGGDIFEFGVMDRGETRSHTFKVRNATDQPLKLVVTSTTCKCTVGELGDEVIAPGETGDVVLEWIARSYDTRFEQTATIDTSNPVRPKILLSVSGQVLQLVQPDPLGVFVNDMPFGSEREQRLLIYNFQVGEPLQVLSHEFDDESSAEFYAFSWHPIDVEDVSDAPEGVTSAVECTLKMLPGVPYGNISQSLRITTDARRSAIVEIPITGRIVSDLLIAGKGYVEKNGILNLGMVHSKAGMERTLRIVARRADVHPVEVTSVVCDPADVLQAEVGEPTPLKDGSVLMFPLKITIPVGAREVSFNGGKGKPRATVKIETTHPVVQWLELDVRFYVADS